MLKPVSLLAAALLCLLVPVLAVADVIINETNFPDDVFRGWVLTRYDKDKSGTLSESEIEYTTDIYIEHLDIKNLKGIEHFTACQCLDCSKNQLTSLDFSKNTALEYLICSENQLSSLDVSGNPSLQGLNCSRNQLSSLDVSSNPSLWELNCSGNQLTSLDLSSNTALRWATLDSNRCTVSVGPDRTLDLRNLWGAFDVTKASGWVGGTVSGTMLTVDSGAQEVTYTYDCGRDFSTTFTLLIKEDTQSNGRIINAGGAASDTPVAVPTLVLPAGRSPAGTQLKYELTDIASNTVTYDVDYIDLSGRKLSLPDGSILCFPYPDGLDETSLSAYRILIHHRMDNGNTEVFSSDNGEIELTKQGIRIRVSSLSPFKITWEALPTPTPTAVPPDLPQTGDSSRPGLWLVLLALSTSALALLLRRRAA